MGRPPIYQDGFNDIAKSMMAAGGKLLDLQAAFDVDRSTIRLWLSERPEFLASVTAGRIIGKLTRGELAEDALFTRAVGYEIEAEKVVIQDGRVIRTPVREHIPADTGALTFLLKNEMPDKFRDKHEFGGNMTVILDAKDSQA